MMMRSFLKPRLGPYRYRNRGIAITDRETEALVRKLADRTGQSLARAVVTAVEERLERLDREMRRRVEWSKRHRLPKPRPVIR